ncbi:putative diguanylate cyclase [Limnospira maxima CS-328]|uniref:Putative diguanylate cyclase n=2 Tax=Limnospira TaxID=2596745 RepID=B5VYX7_LIMMA|nr:hypothetical protein [Limnospira maxima]EDZ95449.1 putative diguanylate cyclase [Limnospira maxima CS-328]MDC0837922.1 diguanylate cyclase [Limnoraphis robusta]
MFTLSMALTMNIHTLTKDLPRRIVLSYAVIGAVWILISDQAIETIIGNYSQFTYLTTFKGLIFMAITSLLLYQLLQKYQRSLQEMNHKMASTKTMQLLIILSKITEYIKLQKQLRSYIEYDSLTKLPWRSFLLDKLESLLKQTHP